MNIPPGFAQVNLMFSGANLPTRGECTFGVEVQDVTDVPASVAAKVISLYDTVGMDTRMTDDVTLSGVLVKFGPNAVGPSALVAASVVGKFVTLSAPPNTTYLLHKNTAAGGRAGRGRMYLPGVAEGAVDDGGTVSSTELAAWSPVLGSFLVGLETQDIPMVLLHGLGGPLLVPTPVTSFTMDSRVATQRRRLRR